MNKWPRNKPKTQARLVMDYRRTTNPVTKSAIREIVRNRSYETRDCVKTFNIERKE